MVDIPQELIDKISGGKKLSPDALKAIFAQLAEKGLLDKPTGKKEPKKESVKGTGSHKGLVLKDVEVKRNGKIFTQKRWVKPGEDESVPKKDKKIEPEKLGSFSVGDNISILGKRMKIEKVSESQETIKMDNGEVYTLIAVQKYGKKITSKPEPKPKKELKIKDLKPIPKKEIKKLPKNKSILLKDLVKSEEEANKFVKNQGWVWDKESDIFPNVNGFDSSYTPIMLHTDDNGKLYGMSQVHIDDNDGDYEDKIVGDIQYLEINTPMRGKGYGRRMIKDVVKELSKCDLVKLHSLDENSNKFYDAIGMKEDEREHYEDHYIGDKKWMSEILNM